MFETFLSEPYTKFFASMREKGMPSSFFVCGDATKNNVTINCKIWSLLLNNDTVEDENVTKQ